MRIACVQSHIVFGNPAANAENAIRKLRELKAEGVDLAVFPEAYLTGYCVDSLEGACSICLGPDCTELELLRQAADELDILVVVGFAMKVGDIVSNAAALFEPGVEPRIYSKTHLPFLGLDRFVQPGSELPVFDTRLGRIGILICYDMRPPEATRVLSLKGAELIVLPTNWPEGAEVSAEHICIARAAENRVFYATCNRTGEENGFRFIGRSKIIHPSGRVLAEAGAGEETIMADLDLAEARQKRTVNIPGAYETEVFATRNVELYRVLLEQREPSSTVR